MKKLLGFLSVMSLFLIMAGPAFGWFGSWGRCYSVPEPSTLLLLGSGILGLAVFGRKRFKK